MVPGGAGPVFGLRAAAPGADIRFIRGLQARPENRALIAADGEAQLLAVIRDPARDLLVWERDGARSGFALLMRSASSRRVEILRLALAEPGRGEGAALIDALLDRAFADPDCAKVWLDVAADNPRAIRAYARAGFQREGLLREHWLRRTGDRADLVLMGILRREWAALRGAG